MSRHIFNSLGSNYTAEFCQLALSSVVQPSANKSSDSEKLTQALQNQFQGVAQLVYKGRDAIELALKVIAKSRLHATKKQAVLTQGLACHAIEEAIVRAGMVPVYVDLEVGTLGPSLRTILAGYDRATTDGLEVVAVFLQHTLGYANPVGDVRQFCDQKKLVFIEDLAQSFGAQDSRGIELGTLADVIICSFGRDKVLDAVSGGAVIIKYKYLDTLGMSRDHAFPVLGTYPPLLHVRKELIYPSLTAAIRSTHGVGIGKVLFQLAKQLGLLTSPISSPTISPTQLPAAYASLVLWQLEHLEKQIEHRQSIAQIYARGLTHSKLQFISLPENAHDDIHLRFPVLCSSPELMNKVLKACTAQNIYITDRWYREVVDSGSLHLKSLYVPGTCPAAEDTASRLLNLPTHRQISIKDAEWIVEVITQAID